MIGTVNSDSVMLESCPEFLAVWRAGQPAKGQSDPCTVGASYPLEVEDYPDGSDGPLSRDALDEDFARRHHVAALQTTYCSQSPSELIAALAPC